MRKPPQNNQMNSLGNWWQPEQFAVKRAILEARAKILANLRSYFSNENFVEVDTPALQRSPCMEPHLHAFKTELQSPHGDTHPFYLATSPEFTCKKLLVAGMERIYQLSHMYRNAECSSKHHPEFMLLEWYRTGVGYDALMDDCEAILKAACQVTQRTQCEYNGMRCDITKKATRITVADAFFKYADVDVLASMDDVQHPSATRIMAEATRIGVRTANDDTWDDVVLRIIGEKIEPHLGGDAPCFLTDYPLPLAALARAKPSDPRVAERFELYVCGLELANAFVELTDASIQRERFESDMKLRKLRYGSDYPIDEEFLQALEYGMPQAAGIALGVDRLVMLATGAQHINDVLWSSVT
ncbi:MAG: EF-P lysine aminoacylase EpmA [Alphaproteobacteria bacterium]|nr:EF-P lysine aminoacylase EpmA [Alphaproteobacteria bacterium]